MKFKPTQQKIKKIHAWVPKLAFGIAGMFLLALTATACQREDLDNGTSRVPQVQSEISSFSSSEGNSGNLSSDSKPSLVISGSESSDVSSSGSDVSKSPAVSSSSALPESSSVASKPPASSALSSGSSVPEVSSKPPSSNANTSVFDDAAFVGNSLIDDLYTYGGAGNADFYFRIGLTVKTVFTKPTATGSVPVIDELNNKSYGKVLLMFGENELGWSYPSVFIEEYGKVIDGVRQRQPNATIYIQSILPVSKAASQKNQNQVNNTRINQYNAMLKDLAKEKGVVYLDVASVMKDSQGNLPDDAAPDGVHPNKKYCLKWLDYLKQNL